MIKFAYMKKKCFEQNSKYSALFHSHVEKKAEGDKTVLCRINNWIEEKWLQGKFLPNPMSLWEADLELDDGKDLQRYSLLAATAEKMSMVWDSLKAIMRCVEIKITK